MKREIDLLNADGDAVRVAFKATAATPIRYKQAFGSDLFRDLKKLDGSDEQSTEIFMRLAYILACAGAGHAPERGGFEDWLDTLDSVSLLSSAAEIVGVYTGGTKTNSSPKNPDAPSPGT